MGHTCSGRLALENGLLCNCSFGGSIWPDIRYRMVNNERGYPRGVRNLEFLRYFREHFVRLCSIDEHVVSRSGIHRQPPNKEGD